MSSVGTVTSKSMVTIPSALRRKYKIREGTKVAFIESDGAIVMVPLPPLRELFGIDKAHYEVIVRGIRELHEERRREARE